MQNRSSYKYNAYTPKDRYLSINEALRQGSQVLGTNKKMNAEDNMRYSTYSINVDQKKSYIELDNIP